MLTYSRGRSITDNHPQRVQVADFEAFIERIEQDRAPNKEKAAYICGPLNGDGRRCAEGVMPSRLLRVDLDKIDADRSADVRLWFMRFRGCAWPTHSSTPDAPRERVVIELDREADRAECIRIGKVLTHDLAEEFGAAVKVDKSTFLSEQAVFVPPVGVTLARFDGEALDVDAYLAAARELPQDAPEQRAGDDQHAGARVGAGQRNAVLSREAYRLRKQGRTVEQIFEVLLAMNSAICDPPLSADEVQTIARGKERIAPDAASDAPEPMAWDIPPAIGADEWDSAALAPACIVENYLFADVACLVAPGGTGKTTTTLFEAVHIALGLPVWGLRVWKPGPVLLITAEDRRDFLVARLREICAALDLAPAEIEQVRELVRIHDCTRHAQRLTAVVRDVVSASGLGDLIVNACEQAHFAPALVQFDPLISFGVGETRVNDSEQALIEAARGISGGLDTCVRYVHHVGKANAREGTKDQYTGRGGSALADGARMVAVMQPVERTAWLKATGDDLEDGDTGYILARPKLSYAPPQPDFYNRRRGYGFERVDAAIPLTEAQQRDTDARQVLALLVSEFDAGRMHSANTLGDIKPENITRARFRAGLSVLLADGRVENRPRPGAQHGAHTYLHPRSVRRADFGEAT